MATEVTFSVVIPCFNSARYVVDAVRSAISQDYQDREIIVVDDGSSDDPAAALDDLKSSINFVRQPNGGTSSARNRGVSMARGRYVVFLDADDLLPPDYLSAINRTVASDVAVDAVAPNLEMFGSTRYGRRRNYDNPLLFGKVTLELFLRGRRALPGCSIFSRDLLGRVGGYREEVRDSEDLDLWIRVLASGARVVQCRDAVYRYRRHDASKSVARLEQCLLAGIASLGDAEQTFALTPSQSAAIEDKRQVFLSELHFLRAKDSLERADMSTFFEELKAVRVRSLRDPMSRGKAMVLQGVAALSRPTAFWLARTFRRQ